MPKKIEDIKYDETFLSRFSIAKGKCKRKTAQLFIYMIRSYVTSFKDAKQLILDFVTKYKNEIDFTARDTWQKSMPMLFWGIRHANCTKVLALSG